ncbi:MAG TPA: hypothetical protein VK449_04085 [Anaerolineales bacterium]|nr:hypothetical protein [Anaerolineales bacterium]
MKSCWAAAGRILAAVLAIAFVVTLPITLMAFNLGRIAFSAQQMTVLVSQTIEETGGLRNLVMQSLTSPKNPPESGNLDLAGALAFLTPPERDHLGDQLTPPGWAEEQLGSLVKGVYDWIDNDRASPSFLVDIRDLKAALLAGGAADLVEMVVDSWPACSVEDVAEMSVGALLGERSLKFCEPPEPLRSGLVGLMDASLAVSLRALPDQIALGQGGTAPASPEVMQAKDRLRRVRFLAGWSWLFSPVLLGLIMALVVRSWRDLALWWGIPVLAGGALALLAVVGVRVGATGLVQAAFGPSQMPVWIGTMMRSLAVALMAVVFRRVALQSVILLIAGAVILATGLLVEQYLSRRGAAEAEHGEDSGVTRHLARTDPDAAEENTHQGPPPTGLFG